MKSKLCLVILALAVVTGCASPTPEVKEVTRVVVETAIVEKEVTVYQVSKETVERTAILVGFGWQGDDGGWLGEIAPYMDVLENETDVSHKAPLCRGPIFEGQIYGQDVLVMVAGTAKVQMATCVQNLLRGFEDEISEIVLTAIAGISPMRGGLVDTDGNLRDSDRAQTGDGCVSYFADDFDLQFLDTDRIGVDAWWTGRWKRPPAVGSKELADELLAAADLVEWPEVPDAPRQNILKYHDTVRKAKMWAYWESIEMTDDLFWHGVIGDARAREMGAWAINQVLDRDVTAEDIVICTTMEAVPLLKVVSQWNEAYGTNVRAAYIRGASNFDHPWLNEDGTPAVSSRESIESGMETGGGVDYAALTEALPMIKLLELRARQ